MIIWTEIISRYIHVNVTTVSLRKRTLLVLKDMNALFNKQPRENQMKAVKSFCTWQRINLRLRMDDSSSSVLVSFSHTSLAKFHTSDSQLSTVHSMSMNNL